MTNDTLAIQQTLRRTLDGLELGEPSRHGGLSVWPLLGGAERADYELLDDVIQNDTARVTELNGGSVPELHFVNDGDRPVLLLDGEQLLGALQNRSLNLTILAPARTALIIPVSCMEAGRWHYDDEDEDDRRFRGSQNVIHPSLRQKRMAHVTDSLRESRGRARRSDQSAVWESIDDLADSLGASSPTAALNDTFEHYEDRLAEQIHAHPADPRQCGAVFAVEHGPHGLELFDNRETYQRLRPKLLRSWTLEHAAKQQRRRRNRSSVKFNPRILLDRLCRRRVKAYDAVGLGVDARLRRPSSRLQGAALVLGQRTIHFAAFHNGRRS